MSRIYPFPRSRNRPFVLRHAGNVASMGHAAGEKYLAQQLEVQRTTMVRRGVDPVRAAAETRALETAIRCELWRLVLTPGGAA